MIYHHRLTANTMSTLQQLQNVHLRFENWLLRLRVLNLERHCPTKFQVECSIGVTECSLTHFVVLPSECGGKYVQFKSPVGIIQACHRQPQHSHRAIAWNLHPSSSSLTYHHPSFTNRWTGRSRQHFDYLTRSSGSRLGLRSAVALSPRCQHRWRLWLEVCVAQSE